MRWAVAVVAVVAALVGGAAVVSAVLDGDGDRSTIAPSQAGSDGATDDPAASEGEPGDASAVGQLTAIAEVDKVSLSEVAGLWMAELGSATAEGDAEALLAQYQELSDRYSDVMLAWSGDWPGSYDADHRNAWVILAPAAYSEDVSQAIDWCASEGWAADQCLARRLSDDADDDPAANVRQAPAQ